MATLITNMLVPQEINYDECSDIGSDSDVEEDLHLVRVPGQHRVR